MNRGFGGITYYRTFKNCSWKLTLQKIEGAIQGSAEAL